jgi:ubiquinone/menaquinone biosynthesis C-methylase UbiE
VKLSDPSKGLTGTPLEQLSLQDESLGGYRRFWEDAALTDSIRAIADQDSPETFEVSGRSDANRVWEALPDGDAVVLEIGCGTGRVLQHLAGRYREVHGIDIAGEMVKQGERRLAGMSNIHFHQGNGYDLEAFADVSVDLVYSALVFQHMPKTIAYNYFRETRRVLRPDGLFLFQVPNLLDGLQFEQFNHFAQPWFVEHPYPMYFWTPAEVVQLLTRAGLSVEHLSEEMVVLARKTELLGPVAQQLQRSMESELGGMTSSGRIAALEGQVTSFELRVTELTRQVDRFRSQPLIRVALAARRALRRDHP